MSHRRSILSSFCLLFLFIFSSNAFSQSGEKVRIKGFFLADSGKAQATAAPGHLRPVRINPARIHRQRNLSQNQEEQSPLLSTAAEAAWLRFHVSATQWQWLIRRPGVYAAECIIGSITSSVDILINFSGFEDLCSSDPTTQNVETYYGVSIGNQNVEEVEWVGAADFNRHPLLIKQNPVAPTYWNLWNKVSVKQGNSALEYSDDAVITFLMQNTTPWIDPDITTGQ